MLSDRLNRWNYCQCSTKFRDTLRRLSEAISHSFGQFFGADYPTSKVKNAIESHTMNIQLKRSIPIKILLRKPTSGRNVWLTVNPKRSISFTQTDLEQKTIDEWRQRIQKRGRSENFESKRGRSGIIGRILQPKGYSYCHTIYYTDTVTESSSERLTPHPPRHCRPWATEYITVRLLYIYHHILSTDNKERLLPPTVSIISGLAL